MESPVVKQAKSALDRLSADEVARIQAEHREMAFLAHQAGMAALREEAEQKGRADLLLHLLTLKFGPQPPSIAERLAHAGPDEVLRWCDRILQAETFEAVFA